MLSPEDNEYFDDLEAVFGMRGWKRIVEEAKSEIYQLQAEALEAQSWDKVCELRGRAITAFRIVNLEDITAMAKQNVLAVEDGGEDAPV